MWSPMASNQGVGGLAQDIINDIDGRAALGDDVLLNFISLLSFCSRSLLGALGTPCRQPA